MEKDNNTNTSSEKTPFSSIIDKYDNFFFDCDGVLFHGRKPLKASFAVLNKLKELGKNLFFVTNSSRNTRASMEKNLVHGGFQPDKDKIFTSSYLSARYLKLKHPDVKKVYCSWRPSR